MSPDELNTYLLNLSPADLSNLAVVSQMSLEKIEQLITVAPTEAQRRYVIVAKYIHLGDKLAKGEPCPSDGSAAR